MKYVSEFRDPTLARHLAQKLADAVQPGRTYRFMEFCGGHTHALARYGVLDLLPPQIQMIHGPGCPAWWCCSKARGWIWTSRAWTGPATRIS